MKTVAMVLGALLAAGVANAQPGAERSEVDLLSEAATHANAGRHPQAIALYDEVFTRTGDPELLPVLGVEYRKAGAQREAVQHFCTYLSFVPRGDQVWFATNQVISIRRELGEVIDARNVCAPNRVDFAPRPPRKGLSTRQRAAVATTAIGAASLTAALLFDSRARSISNQITDHPANDPWPANIKMLEDRGQQAERRALAFGAIGGAALVTAGVLWFTGRESETVIAPTVSATGAGVTFARGF